MSKEIRVIGDQLGANGINDLGWTVGVADTPNGTAHAFLVSPPPVATMTDLGTLGATGWELQHATAISSQGVISGFGLHFAVRKSFMLVP